MAGQEMNVRDVPKPSDTPGFERFLALQPAESLVLINSHDPKHLIREFDAACSGTFGWWRGNEPSGSDVEQRRSR